MTGFVYDLRRAVRPAFLITRIMPDGPGRRFRCHPASGDGPKDPSGVLSLKVGNGVKPQKINHRVEMLNELGVRDHNNQRPPR